MIDHDKLIEIACLLAVFFVTCLCNLSVTIGVHRLWSHRSFKCNRAFKLLLIFFYTMAGQVTLNII